MSHRRLCLAADIPTRNFRRYLDGQLGNWERFSAAYLALDAVVEAEEARLRRVLKLNGAKRK